MPKPAAPPSGPTLLDDPRRLAVVLPALRRLILENLAAPESASGLSRRLGLPRQKLNYHLRALEQQGFVELAETRQRRGCVERRLRATARSYVLDPALLGPLGTGDPASPGPARASDRLSSGYLVATAARLVSDVATLRRRAGRAGKALPTLTIETEIGFATPADRDAFVAGLSRAVARLAARHNSAARGSRRWRFVIGAHAALTADRTAREAPEEEA
jgi:DNA-binding transcriptional ArsR family regulator